MKASGILLASVALALAGCSSREDQAAAPYEEEAGTIAAPVAPTDAPSAAYNAPVADNEIPVGLRGNWGINAADCDASRSDAKGGIVIDANSLRFYESVGKLKKIEAVDAGHIRAQFAFSGEGQNWDQGVDLSLSNDGKTLIRRDSGPDALPDPLTYQACAAQ